MVVMSLRICEFACGTVQFSDGTIDLHFWNVQPFIWCNQNGTKHGLLVDIMSKGELYCTNTKNLIQYHRHSYAKFQLFLKNISYLIKNSSHLRSTILGPIIGFPKHQYLASETTMSPFQLFDSQGFVIMFQKDKVILFTKLWVAMWKCSSIIAIMVCFSVWIGVLIWLMVRNISFLLLLEMADLKYSQVANRRGFLINGGVGIFFQNSISRGV